MIKKISKQVHFIRQKGKQFIERSQQFKIIHLPKRPKYNVKL